MEHINGPVGPSVCSLGVGDIVHFYIVFGHQNDFGEGSEVEGTILGHSIHSQAAYQGEWHLTLSVKMRALFD